MYVMGTAGHVDHGKSTLVTALSGIDPDRLPEEKARGMTIDLGFAWMTTNSGETIGIVDVPGHERFVKNMIAGVGAIDFVLLVVAADDGWMPQSAEHFAILRYLGVARGIVVLTKSDLVEPDWLELVRADVREQVSGTFLADAPIVAVDSVSGRGIDELCGAIDVMTRTLAGRPDLGRPRLYVDRVFTIAGRGAVVTGTLLEGSLSVGDSVMLEPGGVSGRVRDLQIHKHQVATAAPGQRVAINFSGVDRADLHRGQCVVAPADTLTVDRLWVHVGIWTEAVHPLKPGRKVLIMLGTAEPEADAYPVGQAAIAPGQEGLCELRLKEPIKARLKDRFVLRWPTPQVTIGGGEVLEIGGTRRSHRDAHFVECLRGRVGGELAAYRRTELRRRGFAPRRAFLSEGPWSESEVAAGIDRAIDAGEIAHVAGILFDPVWLAEQGARMRETLQETHRAHAYDAGLNPAEWQDQARIPEAAMAGLVSVVQSTFGVSPLISRNARSVAITAWSATIIPSTPSTKRTTSVRVRFRARSCCSKKFIGRGSTA